MRNGQLLDGKVALVTGASRGIGAAAARVMAREGATVVLAARTEPDLKAVVDELDGDASYVIADFGDVESIRRVVDEVVRRHGRLDLAFNNAGVAVPARPIVDFPETDFDLVTRVNYKGVFYAMAAEIKAMLSTAGSGAIVNNSSIGGLIANPILPAYGAAKRAVNSITESAAKAYGHENIRINAIAPGITLTSMVEQWRAHDRDTFDKTIATVPLGRVAHPEEIAEAAAWLLSDRASFVTGAVLPVTGGQGI
jgi:NAD(P)-dependent dehydrogenase (short-subunit alcohol dehydrogenase family)